MKLSELADKPKLIPLQIDDEGIVEKYGDSLEFWVYDRQPLNTFSKLASATEDNVEEVAEIMGELILDESGNKIIQDGNILPLDVLGKCITKITETLGK